MLVGTVALLAACAQNRPRSQPAAVPAPPVEAIPAPIPVSPAPAAPGTIAGASPWQRLRDRFAMPGCDYDASVLRQARQYTKSPDRFRANWQQAMPFLLLVLDEIERRDLPGELALLPYVESHYRPVAGTAKGPSGLWQLMPRTAIDRGLRVGRRYDERLDPVASTRVALDLLERQERQFADWRLASMAFNAGEYRIKGALGGREGAGLSATELAALRLSPTTHQHLARLLALACIVSDPQRFEVSLPLPGDGDELAIIDLPVAVNARLAATLAGIPLADLLRYNPAAAASAGTATPLQRLLLPRPLADAFGAALREIPPDRRSHWTLQRIDLPMPLATLATNTLVPVALLAAANGLAPDAQLERGQDLLVPTAQADPATIDEPAVHVVRAGDTLSAIAREHGVPLRELLRWNLLDRRATLRIGMRLRIRAPEY